jgi:hypothetical protein
MEDNPRFDPKVFAAFNQRIARNALEHQEQYAARTGTILAAKGIVDGVHHENAAPALPAIIADANHPDRVPTPDGPLLFCRSPSGSSSVTCVEMPELILHPEQAVRAGTVQFFRRFGPGLLCQRTAGVLANTAGVVESSDENLWRTAAVSLLDALDDDHLLTLAGIRQSLAVGYNEMVAKSVARALNPSVSAVDALSSEINVAAGRPSETAGRLAEIAREARSLPELCAAYFEVFGHVPLAAEFSLGRAVGLWQQQGHAGPPGAAWWQQAWSWAENSRSPLARYHALSLFTQRPDLLPAELRPALRTELLVFLQPWPEASPERPAWSAALALRDETARHYYDHLSCRVAPLTEDLLGEWTWWMTERFCACFGTDAHLLDRVAEGAIRPARVISAYEAALTLPRTRRSSLCYATEYADSFWSLALLTGIDPGFMTAAGSAFSEPDAEDFVRALGRQLVTALPGKTGEAAPLVYAVDRALVDAVRSWLAGDPGPYFAAALQALADATAERFDPEAVVRRFEGLLSLPREQQIFNVLTLRALLAAAAAPVAQLLACLSDRWLEEAMRQLEPEPRDALLGTLVAAPYPEHEAWLGWLHCLAGVCEQPALDAPRRTAVFEFVVFACALADVVGPLSKLLNGPHRDLFLEDASACVEKFESAYPACAQTVKATIRSVTSILER